MNPREACIALNLIPKLGPVRIRRLRDALGSAEAILRASADRLRQVEGVGPEIAESISHWESLTDLSGELRRVREADVSVLTLDCADYPALLREIHDPPTVLYVWGELTARDQLGLGVVGSRKASHYALEMAKKLSYQTAYAGMTIFSGLARGIDTAAHQGALAAQGRTVAVIGSGLNRIYPRENIPLAEKIATSGAVVSEFPMDTTADRQTFPMRNRIISGCSTGLLVVEAGQNSGALISAGQAADQGRPVFAVPGRIDNPNAIGSNRLIQQGAKLILSAQDILDDLNLLLPAIPASEPRRPAASLSETEQKIYDALGDDEAHIDLVSTKSGLPSPVVSSTLLTLEIRSLVKQLPGSRFVKIS